MRRGNGHVYDAQDLKDLAFIAHELAQPDTRPILRRRRLSDRLLSVFRADFLGQTQWNSARGVFEKPICYNRDQQMSWAYESYYQHCDPISAKIRSRPVATATYQVIPRETLEKTEYFNEFLKPFGVSHGLDQYLFSDGRNVGDLRIWRRSASHEFGRREHDLMGALRPMLVNAYQAMLSGDLLEKAVSSAEFMAVAISADRSRYVCSPALLRWISEHPDVTERQLIDTVKMAARGNRLTMKSRHFRVDMSWRNVSSASQCAILCRINPHADPAAEQRLTAREKQVLRLVTRGRTDREIAEELGVSFWTVRTHVGHLLSKLGSRNRVELAHRFGR